MQKIKCTVYVNSRNGYEFTPKKCDSITEAVKYAREYAGFYYRIYVNDRIVRKGFCH